MGKIMFENFGNHTGAITKLSEYNIVKSVIENPIIKIDNNTLYNPTEFSSANIIDSQNIEETIHIDNNSDQQNIELDNLGKIMDIYNTSDKHFIIDSFMSCYDNSEQQFENLLIQLTPKKREMVNDMKTRNKKMLFNHIFMDKNRKQIFLEEIQQASQRDSVTSDIISDNFFVKQTIDNRIKHENFIKNLLFKSSEETLTKFLGESNIIFNEERYKFVSYSLGSGDNIDDTKLYEPFELGGLSSYSSI